MKITQTTLAAAFLAALAASAQAQEPIDLKYVQLKPGEIEYFCITEDSAGTIEGLGPVPQTVTNKLQQWVRSECLGVDSQGVATVRLTFDRVVASMNLGAMNFAFDSAQNDAPQATSSPYAAAMAALASMAFEARVDAHGNCLQVKGLANAVDSATKNLPDGDKMAEFMREIFNEDLIQDNWFGDMWELPNRKVPVGETWTGQKRMQLRALGEMVEKCSYKLVGTETYRGRTCAKILMTTTMQLDPDAEGVKIPGRGQMKIEVTSQGGTGLILYDHARGKTMLHQTSTPTEGTIRVTNVADELPNFTMTQKFTETSRFEALDGPPPPPTTQPASRQPPQPPDQQTIHPIGARP